MKYSIYFTGAYIPMPVYISHDKNRKGGLCTQQITLLLFLGPNMYGPNMYGPNMYGPNMYGPNVNLVASAAEDNC